MMRKAAVLGLLAAVITVFLAGCGGPRYPELPADAAAFEMGAYIDEADDDAGYGVIEYEGRTYMPYGTICRTVQAKDVAACIGYIVQDGEPLPDTRIYTLAGDPAHHYLMEYYVGTTLMNQPIFWRATDTWGQEIPTPAYIDGLDYGYWQ